ncbi:MAG: hypothetical protein H8D56_22315 [Planctomycetes bacterium]|nr:hypothetical protein [Planctomycetota bacterium]MBL7145846.1 hypothetical protein [Phycisphaerae bacterium]
MSNKKATKSHQYLFYICFDTPLIFRKNLYFNYEGIDFKLIKGITKYQDILCCIIDIETGSGPSKSEARMVQEIALRFLSCLSWELNVGITTGSSYGGVGWSKNRGGLTSVKQPTRITRTLIRNCRVRDIVKLPKIDDKYKANALSLFREAKASNSLYYKFLCYWKILEIEQRRKGKTRRQNEAIDWINNTIKENMWILQRSHLNAQILENKTVGEYLCKECRHAVAHVMADYELRPDSGESLFKIYTANIIVEYLVDIFMKKELGLKFTKDEKDNYLYLRKRKGKVIPVFIPYENCRIYK